MPYLKQTFYSLTLPRCFSCFLVTVLSAHLPSLKITQKDRKKGGEKISKIKVQPINSSSPLIGIPGRKNRKWRKESIPQTEKYKQTRSCQGVHK